MEIQKTSTLCYEALLNQQKYDESILQLLVIARHSSIRCPHLTVFNIIVINISIFFNLLSVFSKYMIVILQFGE